MRARNPRGAGGHLRADILAGAGQLLDETGRDAAVTLRAVARRVGIATTSIYDHFPDRDAILAALVQQGFAELSSDVDAAHRATVDPVARLRAGCKAYLDFATRRPQRYRLMLGPAYHPRGPGGYSATAGARSLDLLVASIADCAATGGSDSRDPQLDASAVLVALHGYAVLLPSRPDFPWPDQRELLDHLVTALARLTVRPPQRR